MHLFIFFVLLVVLILVHELGHFAAAKLFGIKVEEFAIGFPPRLFGVQAGETQYSFNLLLVGGFVRIFGEKAEEGAHSPRSFSHKSRWIQAAVVVAGILMNLVFAWLALSAGYMIGLRTEVDETNRAQVQNVQLAAADVLPQAPAAVAGIMPGDYVESLSANGAVLSGSSTPDDAQRFVSAHANETIEVTVLRGTQERVYEVAPAAGFVADEPARKVLGIAFVNIGIEKLSPPLALWQGGKLAWQETHDTAAALIGFFGSLFRGTANLSEVSGPVGIAKTGATAVASGWSTAILFMALISINLALINIIPIPGLDGGRLLFIAIEGVTRRPISQRIANGFTVIGFTALILLMLVVTWHDIASMF